MQGKLKGDPISPLLFVDARKAKRTQRFQVCWCSTELKQYRALKNQNQQQSPPSPPVLPTHSQPTREQSQDLLLRRWVALVILLPRQDHCPNRVFLLSHIHGRVCQNLDGSLQLCLLCRL